ncbi:hypothetical protein [Hymenobacter seoulensis]
MPKLPAHSTPDSGAAIPPPPVLSSWRAWYWLVLGALGAEIVFFVYLTRLFA